MPHRADQCRPPASNPPPRVRSRIVVVADTCTDDTARITATYPGVDALSLHARSVGAARAEGVDLALQTFRHDPEFEPTGSTGWIRNTDADSAVPDNWFLAQFEFAQSGPDVIVSTVRPDFSDLTPQQIRAWKLRHTPSSANGHIHGANLGVRAPAYIAAGGFHADPKHEDLHLVSERLVALLMSQANFVGLPGPAKVKRLHGVATADDLVHRKFHRLAPNKLHHGASDARRKVYCCAVIHTFSRKIVGWSIDAAQDTHLVVNALDMAIKARKPAAGSILHADHGTQFTSWAFTNKMRAAGLMSSSGTISDCYDNWSF